METLFNHFPQVEDAYNIAQEYHQLMEMVKDSKLMKYEYDTYLFKKRNNEDDQIRNAEELTDKQYFKILIY